MAGLSLDYSCISAPSRLCDAINRHRMPGAGKMAAYRTHRGEQGVNIKQQIAMGVVALIVVAANAVMVMTQFGEAQAAEAQAAAMVAPLNAPELPQDQFRDLTY